MSNEVRGRSARALRDMSANAGNDHHFDGAPADVAAPDEPKTPGWLTLVGIGLVLSVLFLFALKQPEPKTRAELTAGGATTAAAPSAAPAAPATDRPRPMRPPPEAAGSARPMALPSGFPNARPGTTVAPRAPQRLPPGMAAPAPAPGGAPAPHVHRPGEPPH